jgi:hypothetical protein
MRPKPGIRTETPGATLDLADIKARRAPSARSGSPPPADITS